MKTNHTVSMLAGTILLIVANFIVLASTVEIGSALAGISLAPAETLAPTATAGPTLGPMSTVTVQPTRIVEIGNIKGRPAIQPRTNVTDPSTPAFTEVDVWQYVLTHPMESKIQTESAGFVIVKVEFLTRLQLGDRADASTYGPDDRLLCLVTLSGTFSVANPIGAPGAPAVLYKTVYQVYDAHTGNLLGYTATNR